MKITTKSWLFGSCGSIVFILACFHPIKSAYVTMSHYIGWIRTGAFFKDSLIWLVNEIATINSCQFMLVVIAQEQSIFPYVIGQQKSGIMEREMVRKGREGSLGKSQFKKWETIKIKKLEKIYYLIYFYSFFKFSIRVNSRWIPS